MFDQLDDLEFERGEQMHSDYSPDRVPDVRGCIYWHGPEAKKQCGRPTDDTSDYCRAHGNFLDLIALDKALKVGNVEAAEMYLDNMGLTSDDLSGRMELQEAA